MNIVIQSTLKTLEKSKFIFDNLSDDIYCNSTVSPYYSSIGSHIRHILDFYDCIFSVSSKNVIDLTARSRNIDVETKFETAICYLNSTIEKLKSFEFKMDDSVIVIDDLGLGKTSITYTYGGLFSQANSHTIHHYAIINYILDGLKIAVNDAAFGYNPTTPQQASLN
jgi:hypothetical protein